MNLNSMKFLKIKKNCARNKKFNTRKIFFTKKFHSWNKKYFVFIDLEKIA